MAISGINESKLKTKANEIANYAEEASKKLQEIELLIKDSNVYLKGDIYEAIEKKVDTMAVTFPTVKENINSYSEDLTNIINSFKEKKDENVLAATSKTINFEISEEVK